jgi:hypothetical protein
MTMDEINIKFREAVKKGMENGKVLHFSEAFKMFPVEDEEHQGNRCCRCQVKNVITCLPESKSIIFL